MVVEDVLAACSCGVVETVAAAEGSSRWLIAIDKRAERNQVTNPPQYLAVSGWRSSDLWVL